MRGVARASWGGRAARVAPHLRARLEAAIERLIEALDALDGDLDQEDVSEDEGAACEDEGADTGDDEPWLGRAETGWGAVQGSLGGGGHRDVLDGEVLLSPVERF